MKAFVSLHTAEPSSQGDHEVNYLGYARTEIDYSKDFGRVTTAIIFPEILESIDGQAITHVCIGLSQNENLTPLNVTPIIPNIPLQAEISPKVIFSNIPEPLPAGLNPIALAIWHLINNREISPDDLQPSLFEAVNEAFQAVGMPVMEVTRSGVARLNIDISQMPSLNGLTRLN